DLGADAQPDPADQRRHGWADAEPQYAEVRSDRGMTLERVVLDNEPRGTLPPFIEADREQAVADLAAANHFAVFGRDGEKTEGPYLLHLTIQDARLIFDIRTPEDVPLIAIGLALGPFRRLVKDYQMLVDSHIKA